MTTIRDALRLGRAQLQNSPSPALDARLLLEHILGRDHAYLIAHGDDPLESATASAYDRALERALAEEPIPYIIGRAPFMGLDFFVSHDVLIPRPETEQLVELAIEWGKTRGAIRVADVGTGSGCIAVSLARYLPKAEIIALDVSSEALAVASTNARQHAPDRIEFVLSDLLTEMSMGIDLVAANLPYVAGDEWPTLPIGVKSYEPALALMGGPDGLDLIKRLLPQALLRLNPGGLLLLEIGWRQGAAVAALAQSVFRNATVSVLPDFAGHDRIVSVRL